MTSQHENITELLSAWRNGSRSAESELMEVVYPILRDLARARLAGTRSDFTLRATELVNETYLRLAGGNIDWKDRSHFFSVAARAIRNVVVDYVRAKGAEKRGGDLPFVALDIEAESVSDGVIDLRIDWLGVHTALNELEHLNPEIARIVELKFFSGLTNEEIAASVGSSRTSVIRDWRFARSWLADKLDASARS